MNSPPPRARPSALRSTAQRRAMTTRRSALALSTASAAAASPASSKSGYGLVMAAVGRPRREVERPPRPRRVQRSAGGDWAEERVVAALRAWADETGRAPRSYDWSPASARAGGFPLAGAQKWEREHPRWPHHALVVSRFGSWRAALEAAGLPAPPPLRIGRRERIETALRLQHR